MTRSFDLQRIRRAFARAAAGYDAVAALQRDVESRLLDQCDAIDGTPPERVLDLGCGPGRASVALAARWPRAQVLSVDVALPMLRLTQPRSAWWKLSARRSVRICADAAALPFADASLDAIFSSLCVQWLDDLPAALAGFRRVLRPGGLLLFSTFGPETLSELREAFIAADAGDPVSHFAPIQAVGDALQSAGLRDPVLHRDRFTLTYPEPRALMHELRALGAANARADRRRTLTGKARMQRVFDAYETLRADGVLPSSWEVIYAQAFAPPPGQPMREGDDTVVRIPAGAIPIRRTR
jgi:malonyl-CoA O-methyltransferase